MKIKNPIMTIVGAFAAGIVFTGILVWQIMPSMMMHVRSSPLGLEETVATIKQNAEARGWKVSGIREVDKSILKEGGGQIVPVRLVEMCKASYAERILSDPGSRKVAVMMPCSIAVYEDEAGAVHVVSMNMSMMGRMFGGVIAEIMGGSVAREEAEMLEFLSNFP